jgi:hypothetical protein
MAKQLSGPRYQRMLDALDVFEPSTKHERRAARAAAHARDMALKYCPESCHGKGCETCTHWETLMRESLDTAFNTDYLEQPSM